MAAVEMTRVDLGLGDLAGDKLQPVHRRKALSSFAMALLTFSCVAGGPFGIELAGAPLRATQFGPAARLNLSNPRPLLDAVKSAGAFATILGLLFAGLLWGMPQALITAGASPARMLFDWCVRGVTSS